MAGSHGHCTQAPARRQAGPAVTMTVAVTVIESRDCAAANLNLNLKALHDSAHNAICVLSAYYAICILSLALKLFRLDLNWV